MTSPGRAVVETQARRNPMVGTSRHRRWIRLPPAVRVVTVLIGAWLLLAPWILRYGDTGGGFDARWHDLTLGLLLLAASSVQVLRPTRPVTCQLMIVFGFWLAIAPFALAYDLGADPARATVNDTVAGTVLTGFTVSGYLTARDANRWDEHSASAEPSPR